MKKITKITSLLLVTILLLAACGKKYESKTYKFEKNGASVQIEVMYDGDKVVKQKTHNVLKYANAGLLDKEDAKSKIDPISKQYNEVKGIKHRVKYDDKYLVEEIETDFDKLDMEKARALPGFYLDDQAKGGVSFKQTEEALKQSGFVEVK